MKKSLLTGALAAILITASSITAPTDCLAAPPKQPPNQSVNQSVKAPRPSKPPTVNRTGETRKPPAVNRTSETRKPPTVNRTGEMRKPPTVNRTGEMRKPPTVNRTGETRKPPTVRPNIDKKPSNVNRPPQGSINQTPPDRPNSIGKHPNNRPPHDINDRPNDKPPKYRPKHRRHYYYRGLYLPAIYGGYYYGVHYDDATSIMYGITVRPADHPNIFLLNSLLAQNLYSENEFAVFYSGQTALDYDRTHGTGAFYRLAVKNAPDIKKWKSKDTAEMLPTIHSLNDYLTKYHFVPSTDTLFDGKHLYRFDPDTNAFVENQTIEGLTTTYKHGKFYLISAAPQGELPKYYLVLKDAIYETAYTDEADCPDLRELNQDTTRLWKLLK